jgi:hypothetical protein
MPSRTRIILALASLLTAGIGLAPWMFAQQAAPAKEQTVKAGDYQVTGPFTHENLAVFLIRGEDRLKGRKFLMLADALEQKKFVIYETQNVTRLQMENLSATEEVLILSGDILKGGQQDRIARFDQIVPPRSGKQPLTVFCVEHTASRWMKPLTEADKAFHSSPGQLCSNDLRLANRRSASQGEVWKNVAACQQNLSMNAGKSVQAKESDSSLALSLQAKEVRAAAGEYVARLLPVIQGKQDVVGFAFAINGKVYCADVYGSPVLFQKVWPRLLHAAAVEAFADQVKGKKFQPATLALVKTHLEKADRGKASGKDVGQGLHQRTSSGERSIRFETIDQKGGRSTLRRNYMWW